MAPAAASSWIPPPLPDCDGAPGWVLLDMRCYIADLPNATTATGATSRGLPIHVTFRAARPPVLSHLCVHCSGADFPAVAPKVVAAHAGLLLLRVPINPDALNCTDTRFWDYQVYRAHPPALLDLLPNPYPKRFNGVEVALLDAGGGGGYVVAALRSRLPRPDPSGGGALIWTEFDLLLYRSAAAAEGWVSRRLAVEEPVRDAVAPLPDAVPGGVTYHETGKTVTVGGVPGTVAWVDLWRGVLLCDLLDECPVLRDVPLPLPARGNWDRLLQECNPNYLRDITVSRSKDSIKYVEIEIRPPRETNMITTRDSYLKWVRRPSRNSEPARRLHGWRATTWSMPLPVRSCEDWRRECHVDVDAVAIDASELWLSKPLLSKLGGSDAEAMLQILSVGYPTISMDDDAVYLLSKVDNLQVVVAVDVRKKLLRGVAELDIQKDFHFMPSYCSSEISSYVEEDYRVPP